MHFSYIQPDLRFSFSHARKTPRGASKIQSNIYDEAFWEK